MVRRVLRSQRSDVFHTRQSSLDIYLPWLDAQWAAGVCNGMELWRQLKRQGFRGCYRWGRSEPSASGPHHRPPDDAEPRPPHQVRDPHHRRHRGRRSNPGEARELVGAFQAMIRKKALADLQPWIERARGSLIASFVNGVVKDLAAVSAAITSPWSNGQAEGQITKLKLVKRQMYGRGKIDLLQARVISAP